MLVEWRCIQFDGYVLSTRSVPDATWAPRQRLRRAAATAVEVAVREWGGAGTPRRAGPHAPRRRPPGASAGSRGWSRPHPPDDTSSTSRLGLHSSFVHPSAPPPTLTEHLLSAGRGARQRGGGGEHGPGPSPSRGAVRRMSSSGRPGWPPPAPAPWQGPGPAPPPPPKRAPCCSPRIMTDVVAVLPVHTGVSLVHVHGGLCY